MGRYLLSLYRAEGYDPSGEGAEVRAAIDAVNAEMVAAGVRVFVGGLHPVDEAVTVGNEGDVTAGPYREGGFVGGLWVLEVGSREEAEAWAKRAAAACRGEVEVRGFW